MKLPLEPSVMLQLLKVSFLKLLMLLEYCKCLWLSLFGMMLTAYPYQQNIKLLKKIFLRSLKGFNGKKVPMATKFLRLEVGIIPLYAKPI
ncbi:hypothetical protein D3C85_982650 [compost metagenome]